MKAYPTQEQLAEHFEILRRRDSKRFTANDGNLIGPTGNPDSDEMLAGLQMIRRSQRADDTATIIRWLYFACGLGLGWLL